MAVARSALTVQASLSYSQPAGRPGMAHGTLSAGCPGVAVAGRRRRPPLQCRGGRGQRRRNLAGVCVQAWWPWLSGWHPNLRALEESRILSLRSVRRGHLFGGLRGNFPCLIGTGREGRGDETLEATNHPTDEKENQEILLLIHTSGGLACLIASGPVSGVCAQ